MGTACLSCGATIRPGAPYCAQCGVPCDVPVTLADLDPLIGRVLARKYKILSVLGEGGMGRVYKAEQQPLNVEVVIKTLHAPLVAEPLIVQRFFREAQAASRLRHPNCVSVHDFGDADGTLFIAMEFLRGRSLGKVRDEAAPLEPKRAVRIMSQVLDVLEMAHLMNIVHRDLKPDNIMVEDLASQRDFVKVLDFGIAKILDPMGRNERLTQTGMIFGTPQYMSPEQATGGEVDGRADLYSVGVMMFELLTKKLPITAPSIPQLLVSVVGKPAPKLLTVREDLPPKLALAVDMALSKYPEDRFQTAQEMKVALEAAIDPTLVPVATPPPYTVIIEQPTASVEMKPCPRCQSPLAVTAKFCAECGASVTQSISDLQDKLSDLRRFLPSQIVEEIADMRVRGGGEKRQLVVLVADFGGAVFSDPTAAERVTALYEELAQVALRRTGTFERRPGGAVVVFGLILGHVDEAERAIATAVELRDHVVRFTERNGVPAEATFVIHGGQAVVETTPRGPSYAPVGDTLELPTRLAGSAAAGKVLVTEHIEKLVRTVVPMGPLKAVSLKGRPTAIPTFEVLEGTATAVVPHVALARPPTVGRDDAIEAILAHTGPSILILGEPGIGKSRLLDELAMQCVRKRQIAIVAPARPDASRVSPTLAAIVEALGGTSDALRDLGLDTEDARLVMRALQRRTGDSLDVTMHAALAIVLRPALEKFATRLPVRILIDDAHLADRLTAALIENWANDAIPRVTLVVSARSGHAVEGMANARTATLAGLDVIDKIVEGALYPTPAPISLRGAVVARAAGSPLMALEILRTMIDHGVLTSVNGRWVVTGDVHSVPTPNGLQALYGARIDSLHSHARDAIACAAVIGIEVPIVLLDRVLGAIHPALSLERTRGELIGRGLLVATDIPDHLRFAEPSARDIVYERLLREPRRELHRQVAEALEVMASTSSHPLPEEVIGEHFDLGGDHVKALDWLGRACDAALRNREYRRASGILFRARNAARTAGDLRSNRRLAEDSVRLADVLIDLGDLAAARDVIAEGIACAHKEDDPTLISRTRRARGRMFLAAAKLDDAATDLDAALATAVGLRDKQLIAELHGDLGEVHEKRGDHVKAIEYTMRAFELLQGGTAADVQRVVLRFLTSLGRLCVRDKNVDRAERFLKQGLELAQNTGDKLGAAKVLGNLAAVWHSRGDYATAIELSTKALELSRELGDLMGTARQLTNLGTLCSLRGDNTNALRNLDSAYTLAHRIGWREGMASAAAARDRVSSARRPAR